MASPNPLVSPTSFARVLSPSLLLTAMALTEDSHHFQFSLKIVYKLDEKNFHLWRQQMEPYINVHNLTDFVVCTRILPKFLDDEVRRHGKINHAFSFWLQKDQ